MLAPEPAHCQCCFNTQPPEGGCAASHSAVSAQLRFQHTAARRRLRRRRRRRRCGVRVSTHSRPKAAARRLGGGLATGSVSTHSRPKAAATFWRFAARKTASFNTQPPEGGCLPPLGTPGVKPLFQHTAARRRLPVPGYAHLLMQRVSTHSRPKAAAFGRAGVKKQRRVSTHSRPKAAAAARKHGRLRPHVSTHSRPKAAALAMRC